MVNYRGGKSSIGYQLGNDKRITGFGRRKYGRGEDGEDVERITEIKKQVGRPRNVAPQQNYKQEEESEIIPEEPRKRGRKAHVYTFQNNITETLNLAMADLKAEEMQIKKNTNTTQTYANYS